MNHTVRQRSERRMHVNGTPVVFWLVWNEEGRSPVVKHSYKEDAQREAERLARENTGDRFYVLKAISQSQVNPNPVETVTLEEAPF